MTALSGPPLPLDTQPNPQRIALANRWYLAQDKIRVAEQRGERGRELYWRTVAAEVAATLGAVYNDRYWQSVAAGESSDIERLCRVIDTHVRRWWNR